MSTVVGTCTDCIVTLPVQPNTSMRYSVVVTEGNNLILKNRGQIDAVYASNTLGAEHVTLGPQQQYTWSQPFSSLCIGTDQPVQVSLMTAVSTVVFTVTKLLIIDQQFIGLSILNPASDTTVPVGPTANVALYFTQ